MFGKTKIFKTLLFAVVVFFMAITVWAASGDKTSYQNDDGEDVFRVDGTDYYTHALDGLVVGTDTVKTTFAIERAIQFSPASFTVGADIVDGSSSPDIEEENNYACIVWDDANTTAVATTFKVPADYLSGGAFRAFCDTSTNSTATEVDFQVYASTDCLVWDAAATDQTPVALAQTAGTPELVTLTVATDFATLAAGNVVALDIWRDDTADGTADLEMYYVEFYYTASQ